MKLHHIAIWTFRLEELKEFYVRFFGGKSNEKYVNPKKGFGSYFISFGEGPSLELMSRPDVQNMVVEENGYFESIVLDPDGNRIECVYKKEDGKEN